MAGWIGLYVDEPDIELLRERLNEDPEIAFILPEGPGRWRAVGQVDDAQGQAMLWHVPGGPLPLLAHGSERDTLIEEPFAGWTERRAGRDRTVPYFGWYGRMMGVSPLPTRRWWRRFGDWVRRRSVRVTRDGPLFEPHADIWAMPAGLRAIQSGVERRYTSYHFGPL